MFASESYFSFLNIYIASSSSSNWKRFALLYEVHPDLCFPHLVTQHAQSEYKLMRHCMCPDIGITFNSFPNLLENFISIGWESLVIFNDRNIYHGLIVEFYSHLTVNRDEAVLLWVLLSEIYTCESDTLWLK